MYLFNTIGDSSYKLEKYNHTQLNNFNNGFRYIRECLNINCIYNRNCTKLREKFEKKIVKFTNKKDNISILFFGSFLLLQELVILTLLGKKISEVHFTDYAYQNFLKNNSIFAMAFMEFLDYTIWKGLDVKIYIHSNPENLKKNSMWKRCFDIICGIDFDYNLLDNYINVKEIASHSLKIDGIMYLSQNREDLVDLSEYRYSKNNKISLVKTNDYVKPKYYRNYWWQNIFLKILRSPIYLLLMIYDVNLGSIFIFYYIIYLLNEYPWYEQKILDLRTLTKPNTDIPNNNPP